MIKLVARLAALLITALVVAACASDDEPAPSSEAPIVATPPPSNVGTLSGTILYAGPKTGLMRIALFHSIPVTTPPVAAKSYPVTSFPAAYSLPVPAGSYKVYAFLDVASDGYVASEGDPRSPAQDATIPAEGTFVQDITLE